MCVYIGWQHLEDPRELAAIQQQLDPSPSGKIARDRFLTWLTKYYDNDKRQQLPNKINHDELQRLSSNQRVLEDDTASRCATAKLAPATATVKKQDSLIAPLKPEVKAANVVATRVEAYESTGVDWNEEFKRVTQSGRASDGEEAEEGVLTKNEIAQGLAVAAFLKRFREAAELLVQTIVHELTLSDDAKSVPELPLEEGERELVSCSGDARMHRYGSNGLIAFVVDKELRSTQSARAISSTTTISSSLQSAIAHKQLGHQLRASRAIYEVIHRHESDCSSLRVPLQCMIDYLGSRCIVFASSHTSLIGNGTGLTHHHSDFGGQLRNAFNVLGLMTDSLAQASISSTMDEKNGLIPPFAPRSVRFEAAQPHQGDKTRQIFIYCLYDLFPADVPATSSSSDPLLAQATEFALFKFRPEFVKLYGELLPLHSNAHLPPATTNEDLSDDHPQHEVLEMQLLQQVAYSASQYLQFQVIPSFVHMLEKEGGASSAHVYDSRSLTRALHREGINVRYLGICFSLATKQHVKRLLLSEMLARVCKMELRAALRTIVHETAAKVLKQALRTDAGVPEAQETAKYHAEYEQEVGSAELNALDPEAIRKLSTALIHSKARQVVVTFFNLVLGTSSAEAKLFWKDRILPHVRRKFGLDDSHHLLNIEAIVNDDLLHAPQVFQALQTHAHVAFADDRMSFSWKSASPLALEDLQSHSLAPLTNLIARTTTYCEDALANVDSLLESQQFEDALLQLKLHIAILSTSPTDERALPLSHLLVCAAELSSQLGLLDDAERFAALAIENGPKNHAVSAKAHTISMKLNYHMRSDLDAVRLHFTQAVEVVQWHLGSSHPLLLDTYLSMIEILGDCGEHGEALKVLSTCTEMARECFGKASLVYADLRRKQGQLLYESRAHLDEAVGVLEDAISVYEKHFQHDTEAGEGTLSLGSSCKVLAASCCFLIAAIHKELSSSRTDTEKAFSMARRAFILRKEVLSDDHVDSIASLLQLGALANELGDHFRALEYLKPALVMLKQLACDDEEAVEQIRIVTQTMVRLQFQALGEEKKCVVERTTKRFAGLMASLAALYNNDQASPSPPVPEYGEDIGTESRFDSETSETIEAQLLAFVMKKLFTEDASEYLESLVEKTNQELQTYRRQYTMNLTGTMRKESAEAPSPHFKRMQTPATFGSRFASFSGAESCMSPPGSPSPSRFALPLSPTRSDALAMPGSPVIGSDSLSSPIGSRRLSFSQMDCSFLTTASGEFTFGGQLAALLFLAEQPAAGEGEAEGDV